MMHSNSRYKLAFKCGSQTFFASRDISNSDQIAEITLHKLNTKKTRRYSFSQKNCL